MTRRSTRGRQTSKTRRPTKPMPSITGEQLRRFLGLALLALALLTLLGLLSSNRGVVILAWLDLLTQAVGWGIYATPLAMAAGGIWLVVFDSENRLQIRLSRFLGISLLYVVTLTLFHHVSSDPRVALERGARGGVVGYWLSQGLTTALGWASTLVVLITLAAIGLMAALDVSLMQVASDLSELVSQIVDSVKRRAPDIPKGVTPQTRPPSVRADRSEPTSPSRVSPKTGRTTAPVPETAPLLAQPLRRATSWALPQISDILVESDESQMSLTDIREKTRIIEETLNSLGVPVTVVEVNPGPVVTQFGLEPGYVERNTRQGKGKRVKVKVSRISALSNDLALALSAAPIRIEAPVPGKGIVGLEIPNAETTVVGLRSVMEADEFRALESSLAVGLGRDVSGAAVVDNLPKLPHLLIAGATGSGKSVCINALIACLLCQNTPDDLRLLMVDPKRVELALYAGIPHLLTPVIVDVARVVPVLNWVTGEMDRRYKVFASVGARNIETFNKQALARGEDKLPYIAVFIDELADLMMAAPDDVERSICRIAQMARATGIHLIIATQRPSVDVVTGLIKANFPARISFAVSSQIDSRVILDTPGADKLLGRGDALYMPPDSPKLLRIQGCYVSDVELTRLVNFWKSQAARQPAAAIQRVPPEQISGTPLVQRPLWSQLQIQPEDDQNPDQDPLLNEAISVVVNAQRASVSFLQRNLKIGYTRAARLIDELEDRDIIGPATGTSKARPVLWNSDDLATQSDVGRDPVSETNDTKTS